VSTTLTVSLDSETLRLAEQEARARHTTLPEVVVGQLSVMARNWQDTRNATRLPRLFGLRQYLLARELA
jgi:hypothetical protein